MRFGGVDSMSTTRNVLWYGLQRMTNWQNGQIASYAFLAVLRALAPHMLAENYFDALKKNKITSKL